MSPKELVKNGLRYLTAGTLLTSQNFIQKTPSTIKSLNRK